MSACRAPLAEVQVCGRGVRAAHAEGGTQAQHHGGEGVSLRFVLGAAGRAWRFASFPVTALGYCMMVTWRCLLVWLTRACSCRRAAPLSSGCLAGLPVERPVDIQQYLPDYVGYPAVSPHMGFVARAVAVLQCDPGRSLFAASLMDYLGHLEFTALCSIGAFGSAPVVLRGT